MNTFDLNVTFKGQDNLMTYLYWLQYSLKQLKANPHVSRSELAQRLGLSRNQLYRQLTLWAQDYGVMIQNLGSDRRPHWKINQIGVLSSRFLDKPISTPRLGDDNDQFDITLIYRVLAWLNRHQRSCYQDIVNGLAMKPDNVKAQLAIAKEGLGFSIENLLQEQKSDNWMIHWGCLEQVEVLAHLHHCELIENCQ